MNVALDRTERGSEAHSKRRIDVTDMHTKAVDEYVRRNVRTDRVSLEHRGGRTYLVLEE